MTKLFKSKDLITIDTSIAESTKSDATSILKKDKAARLELVIDATHSGVLINHRVYPANHVSQGFKSFISKERGGTAEYDKPILKHHDLDQDPIGRIIDARYTQLKFGDEFNMDYLSPEAMGGKGSGVVTIKAVVTDQESIQKIIDGRLLTVSAGHSTPYMLCSVCAESVRDCEHIPGHSYQLEDSDMEVMCYGITGPMTYHETSFVNLPASPAAKLVNYNWLDSKDSLETSIITSLSKGKRDMVRALDLVDENGELSLLNGRHKPSVRKTVVAVSPATADKLKNVMSSDNHDEPNVTTNVHRSDSKDTSGASNIEQNLDKANHLDSTSKEETTMDEKEIIQLKADYQSLKDKLAAAEASATDLKKQVEAKDSQIQRLTADATELQAKVVNNLAVSLAGLRVRLKKPGTEGIDSKEKLDAYVGKLATRSLDSLQDSLEDVLEEMAKVEAESKDEVSTKDLISEDKLNAPTLSKGAKPTSTNKKSDKPARKSGADALSRSLGLED